MDKKERHLIKLQNPDNEDTSNLQRVGYGWVRNSLALDDDGGIYLASRNYMHKVVWTNTSVSSPNDVTYVSLGGSQHVYFIGAQENKWTLEALNWYTGESTFHYVIGGQRYNSQFSSPIPDGSGGMIYGTTWGRARIVPKQE